MKGILLFVFWGLSIAAVFHLSGSIHRALDEMAVVRSGVDAELCAAKQKLDRVQRPEAVSFPAQNLLATNATGMAPGNEEFDRLFARAMYQLGHDAKQGTNRILKDWGIAFE